MRRVSPFAARDRLVLRYAPMNARAHLAPLLLLPRPTLAAWTLSALAHVAVLAGPALIPFESARPGAFREMEVAFVSAGTAPTAVRTRHRVPLPAVPTTANGAPSIPVPNPETTDAAGGDHDEPLVESRYDVAALNNPKPPYPLAARRLGIEGRVVLRVHVLADGRCDDVQLARSSGSALLDESALSTVRRWRFLPATRGGTPVAASVNVPISFRLDQMSSNPALAAARR